MVIFKKGASNKHKGDPFALLVIDLNYCATFKKHTCFICRSRNSLSRNGGGNYESARTTPQFVQLEMSPDDSNPQLIFYTHE